MVFIGIDPGVGGGIAAVSDDGVVIVTHKMPTTDRDVLDVVIGIGGSSRAMLEFVRSSPQMGVTSAFTFGSGYGRLRMALVAVGIPFDEVTPLTWQKALGCRTHGDKNVSKGRAQELFPTVTVTHAIADALLIAEYARRVERGLATRPKTPADRRPSTRLF